MVGSAEGDEGVVVPAEPGPRRLAEAGKAVRCCAGIFLLCALLHKIHHSCFSGSSLDGADADAVFDCAGGVVAEVAVDCGGGFSFVAPAP